MAACIGYAGKCGKGHYSREGEFWLWEDSGSRGNAQKRQALEHNIQIKLAVLDLLYALWLNAVLV